MSLTIVSLIIKLVQSSKVKTDEGKRAKGSENISVVSQKRVNGR
jgi:hypothetical protein